MAFLLETDKFAHGATEASCSIRIPFSKAPVERDTHIRTFTGPLQNYYTEPGVLKRALISFQGDMEW